MYRNLYCRVIVTSEDDILRMLFGVGVVGCGVVGFVVDGGGGQLDLMAIEFEAIAFVIIILYLLVGY